MVVFEDMANTRTLLTWEGPGGFSAGSGRLRTVSARAGISLISGRATGFAFARRCLRRYQRKMAITTATRTKAPMIPPARAPLLTPEDELDEAL